MTIIARQFTTVQDNVTLNKVADNNNFDLGIVQSSDTDSNALIGDLDYDQNYGFNSSAEADQINSGGDNNQILNESDINKNYTISNEKIDNNFVLETETVLSGNADDGDTIYSGADNDTIKTGGNDDTIYSGAGHDDIYSGAGDDYVDGGSGHDDIYGGKGKDVLIGGTGQDDFIFEVDKIDETDTIKDFNSGEDTIILKNFGAGAKVEYDQNTGELFVDGNPFVRLTGAPVIDADDIDGEGSFKIK